jgi:hypothetical protein
MLVFWITIGGNKTNGFFLQIDDFEDKLVFLHLSCCWSFVCERFTIIRV